MKLFTKKTEVNLYMFKRIIKSADGYILFNDLKRVGVLFEKNELLLKNFHAYIYDNIWILYIIMIFSLFKSNIWDIFNEPNHFYLSTIK